MKSIINYIRDTKSEMKHVSWPSTSEAVVYTALVVGISVLVAFFTGALDFGFNEAVNLLIK